MTHHKNKTPYSVVRANHQFGPDQKPNTSVRLFLDDARNPPLNEKGWVVVRTVVDGAWFIHLYGKCLTEISIDNDLGDDPQGYELLQWVLDAYAWKPICFPLLRKFTIHTGNMPKWRLMVRMLRGRGFIVQRRVPTDRIYPRASEDKRYVRVYRP